MADPTEIVEFLTERLHWHEFIPWRGDKPKPNPTACGGCGRPEAKHPQPLVSIVGTQDVWALGRLVASYSGSTERGTDGR